MTTYKYKFITGSINVLEKWNHKGYDGEYEGGGTFKFPLINTVELVDLTGKRNIFTHVKLELGSWYSHPITFVNGSKTQVAVTPAPTRLWRDLYESLSVAEQGNGQLKDWCFSDEIEESAFPDRKRRWPS